MRTQFNKPKPKTKQVLQQRKYQKIIVELFHHLVVREVRVKVTGLIVS